MKKTDFHKMVGYQIYPKSFKDSNGDGFGDINGIIEKLPYLVDLGVDFLWINPIYKSPQFDGGYDISDYYAIDEMFGTLDEFKILLEKAHENGLKIIMDLVVNHTSDQHPWFVEARKSKDNPYRDYYHWQKAEAEQMPNDWKSFLGTSAWTFDEATQEAYFHIFAKEQPDLNWENPELRAEIYKMVRWWLELGVDGFRLDAISHIKKMPWDFKIKSWRGDGPWQPFMNVPGIETYMADLKAIFDEYGALTVGEASGVRANQATRWTAEDSGYTNMIFELEHNARRNGTGYVYGLKKSLMHWQLENQGWNALYLENHDQPRVIDTFGDGTLESAKALAVAYMLLRGTPFIYQGQEIGMRDFPFTDKSQVREPAALTVLSAGKLIDEVMRGSREHSRTPMQWTAGENAGFSTGQAWMDVHPDFTQTNVAQENSLFKLYQALICLRHNEPALADGSVKFIFERHLQVFAYMREEFLVLVNLGAKISKIELPSQLLPPEVEFEQILGSTPRAIKKNMTLEAWEYHVFKRK